MVDSGNELEKNVKNEIRQFSKIKVSNLPKFQSLQRSKKQS